MTKESLLKLLRGIALLILLLSITNLIVSAQDEPPVKYYQVETVILEDGTSLARTIINGPPKPPPGYEHEREPVDLAGLESIDSAYTIPDVPAFDWVMGCSATSAAMIAGYYDRTSYPNIYTGPANGGVVPMNNSIWGTWIDGTMTTYGQSPLSATRQGLDGRATKGHIDDYWVGYGSSDPDPFAGNWAEHTYGDSTGDYMKTNQTTNYGNVDGSTTIYSYTSIPAPLTCDFMESQGIHNEDGTYGWKLFYESRGYSVTECYNQKTDNTIAGGFSFADYKAEIDAGFPVMIHVEGHTMAGVGYNDTGSTVYLHDTWDYATHSMPWGGSYQGMVMQSVSIVHLEPAGLVAPVLAPIENTDGDGNFLVDWSDVTGAITYTLQVDDNGSFSHPTAVYSDTASQYMVKGQPIGTYYYRVNAQDASQSSDWSNAESAAVTTAQVFLPLVLNNYTPPVGGWVDIMTEDFEGTFPGDWELYEGGSGEYHWGVRNCQVYAGSYSGWAVGGGADGSGLSCGSNYPNNAYSWLIWGPFSMEAVQEVELNLMVWLYSESNYDGILFLASTDGNSFDGYGFAGNSGGWFPWSVDLTDVNDFGNLIGEPQVWIAVLFTSNNTVTLPNGAFVDNIVLRKCETNCPAPSPMNQALPSGLQVKEMQLER